MPAAAIITLMFLLATVLLLVLAQLTKRESRARSAAIASIVTILIADYYLMNTVREGGGFAFERTAPTRKAAHEPNVRQQRSSDNNGGSGASGSSADAGGSRSVEPQRGAGEPSNDKRSNEQDESTDSMDPSAIGTRANALARSLAGWLGSKIESDPTPPGLTRIDVFSDCPECPEMVRIAPGELRIGAAADDTLPLPGEEPARVMRVWPGFAIGRFEISAEQLARSGIGGSCRPAPAQGEKPAATIADIAHMPAACVTAGDISNYLAWLKHKTGRRYRLPTAAEWEFAARSTSATGIGPERMTGGVAEIVADCWSAARPVTLVATGGNAQRGSCAYRIVKDAADSEPAQWRRVSARRAIAADAASPLVGFRIIRDFDLTAAKGF